MALASAVSKHPMLPEGDSESLEEYFAGAEQVAERLAALESRTLSQ